MQLITAVVICLTLYFAAQVLLAARPQSNAASDSSSENQVEVSETADGLDSPMQLRRRLKKVDKLEDGELASGYLGTAWDADSVSESPTLRQVFFIHRHGDRCPTEFEAGDNLRDEPFWKVHGPGQLTNRGKSRVFMLGKMVRKRYNTFLEGSVSKLQMASRSSGSLRCLESGQLFLAGFLSLDQLLSPDASLLVWDRTSTHELAQLWQPASIRSVPVKMDGMLAEGAECKVLDEEYEAIDAYEVSRQITKKYSKESQVLNSTIGFKLDRFWKWLWAGSVIDIERSYFPDKIKPQLLQVLDRVQEASNLAMNAYQATHTSRRLRAGLLINEILLHMDRVLKKSPGAKKFVHYVGHDLTLVVLLGMLDSIEAAPYRPDFAANIAIELHQDIPQNQEEWFINIFYMPKVPAKPVEIHFERCEQNHPKKRCTLDKFAELVQQYRVEGWQAWMTECKNDFSFMDPYASVS